MKCANCGETERLVKDDEGDTFYCQSCFYRTYYDSGKLCLKKCRFCKKMACGKAANCRHCGNWIAEDY
jgi:hypothetical protein